MKKLINNYNLKARHWKLNSNQPNSNDNIIKMPTYNSTKMQKKEFLNWWLNSKDFRLNWLKLKSSKKEIWNLINNKSLLLSQRSIPLLKLRTIMNNYIQNFSWRRQLWKRKVSLMKKYWPKFKLSLSLFNY